MIGLNLEGASGIEPLPGNFLGPGKNEGNNHILLIVNNCEFFDDVSPSLACFIIVQTNHQPKSDQENLEESKPLPSASVFRALSGSLRLIYQF